MNKQDLIDHVSASTGESRSSTTEAINAILNAVAQALTLGDTVQLTGFGTFSLSVRAERAGRNPATGEAITIPASKVIKFSAGKAFKDVINS